MMLRAALGFFTRLPIGSAPLPPTFRGVAVWLPVVGLIIGAYYHNFNCFLTTSYQCN